MKVFRYGLAMMFIAVLAVPAMAWEVDVCVDPTTDVVLDDLAPAGFSAGDGFVAVGKIFPGGSIQPPGVASCDPAVVGAERIGTFFARGRIVLGLPAAEADDLAYVDWQFRIDGRGAIDTSGPVKVVPSGGTYPQSIVGATPGLAPARGDALTTQLDAAGFQIRLHVPGNRGQGN
jgi:hypothetical protein